MQNTGHMEQAIHDYSVSMGKARLKKSLRRLE
jgi:hypothetical protein